MKPPVKVAIIVPWGENLGGAEMMLWTFLRSLDRRRLEPFVVFLAPGPFEREVAGLGIRTAVVPIGRLRQPRRVATACVRLARLLRREAPDVLLNWVAKAQIYGAAAAVAAGLRRRVVWWQHGVPAGHWMDRVATALPTLSVGCSSTAAAAAQGRLWPRRRVFVVHPGIEPPETSARAPAGRPVVIGIVGRLQPWKGQHRVLLAVAMLRTLGLDVAALVVGGSAHGLSPGYEDRLRAMVAQLGLDGYATFTGQVEDVSPHLSAMDVFVSASEREPFGIVLLEAMAHRLPVVAVGDAGPTDIVIPGETGTLVAAPDAALIADALVPLVEDPGLRRAMGERGHARILQSFTAQRMADALQIELEGAARRS